MEHEPDSDPEIGERDTLRETDAEIGERPTLRWVKIVHKEETAPNDHSLVARDVERTVDSSAMSECVCPSTPKPTL